MKLLKPFSGPTYDTITHGIENYLSTLNRSVIIFFLESVYIHRLCLNAENGLGINIIKAFATKSFMRRTAGSPNEIHLHGDTASNGFAALLQQLNIEVTAGGLLWEIRTE